MTSNIILSRLHLSLRRPSHVEYPETIDVDLPDSFLKDDGNDGGRSKGDKRKRQGLWRTEVIAPLPVGWNPSLLYVCLQILDLMEERRFAYSA